MASHCLVTRVGVSGLCNTLTRSILRDYSSARLDSFFQSRRFLAPDTVFLFSLLSPGCKFLESPRSPGTLVASVGSSSCISSAPVSAHLLAGKGVSDSSRSGRLSSPCPDTTSHVPTISPPESSSSHTGLQGIACCAALVDVEQGVSLAPSPGSSSSTSKDKFPLELDARATFENFANTYGTEELLTSLARSEEPESRCCPVFCDLWVQLETRSRRQDKHANGLQVSSAASDSGGRSRGSLG